MSSRTHQSPRATDATAPHATKRQPKRGQPADIPDPAPEARIDRIVSLVEPFIRVIQPKLYGVEHLPADGSLLVGNHTIYGLLDVPFMIAEVWKRRRIAVRGLGENAHYAVPLWRDVLTQGGMVRGTRENVRSLMRAHETILVFPRGGTRGQQAARPALPASLAGAHRLRPARARAGLSDRPRRCGRRRGDVRRDHRSKYADL